MGQRSYEEGTATGPRRVLIVEDHPLLAEALQTLLERRAGFEVVGTESTIAGMLARVARDAPDLVVLDQHLPDGKGTDAIRRIQQGGRGIQVVGLTADASDETLLAAIEAGAAGFIPKSEPAARIIELLSRAAAGEIVIPVDDLVRLVARQTERRAHERERERVASELTPRDREILTLIAAGIDTKEIAARTGLTVNTVRGHVQAVIEKLETHSRLEAVLRAAALGLVAHPGERQ
ncbi:MAG TPA: response regulator transcription factor [Candidatus Acidoferrales bacterium]|nr:response regulator transcription factor [Candidatus Acidoferrales bacterium]